jgi:hypothetical protein
MGHARKYFLLALMATAMTTIAGCVTTTALDHAVVAYDTTTADSVSKQLLLNIARSRYDQPIHFTAISNIAATYRFNVTAGVAPAAAGGVRKLTVPTFGTIAEENPTISIAPMQGDEFTQRLLTPFPEQKLSLLLSQGYDVDSLLRLMASEVRLKDASGRVVDYFNRPSDRQGYTIFRQVMTHLSSIQDRDALQVQLLDFQLSWNVPVATLTPETFASTYKDYSLIFDAAHGTYLVSKRVGDRVVISNYDPDTLPSEERFRLHEEAENAAANDVLLDIRPGYPGGEYPMHGWLRLRSFHEILTFIGRGMAEEPEFDVAPDPRTPSVTENPAHILEIAESSSPPPGGELSVAWNGHYYAVRHETGYQWNRKAFSLLYQLFQMSVAPVDKSGPAITISK